MKKRILAPLLAPAMGAEQPDATLLNILLDKLKRVANVNTHQPCSMEEWKSAVKDVNIIAGPKRVEDIFNKELFDAANELEMIQTFSIGYDYIDIPSCTERGIVVCNVAEIYSESVAQHIWALILDLSKCVSKADRAMRDGKWLGTEGHVGFQLWGKTLGIVGLGAIGGRVALKGRLAFGMRVLAYDPHVLPARAQLYGAELVSLEKLLKRSDVVVVCVPLTEKTYHMIGEKQLSMMKKSAIIVNISRKSIEDGSLIECLKRGGIGGAGLDAFDREPLPPDNPFIGMENVVLTPEIASATIEGIGETFESAVSNVIRYIGGKRPNWMINPEVYDLVKRKGHHDVA